MVNAELHTTTLAKEPQHSHCLTRTCPQMSADVRRKAKKTANILRRTYCGHSGHVTADMSADLSAGVRWYVRRSKMSAVSADFVKKTGDICGHVLECRGSYENSIFLVIELQFIFLQRTPLRCLRALFILVKQLVLFFMARF